MHFRSRLYFLLATLCVTYPETGFAQPETPLKTKYETRRNHDPNGIGKFYMGREIAFVMTHEGAGWLDRTEREKEESPRHLLEALKIKPTDVIIDFGAGSGFYTLRLARQAPKGKIIAVDIQPEMLAIFERKKKAESITNIELIRCTENDPKLKTGSADLIVLVDVYHELSSPYEVTRLLAQALKPGGRLVLVELRLEDPDVPIKLVHKMSEKQALHELDQIPELEYVETLQDLPWQHIVIHRRKRP